MRTYFLSVCFLLAGSFAAKAVVIVKNHQPQASIVIAADASTQVKTAAGVLQKYIKQSTGANLPIVTGQPAGNAIYVGANRILGNRVSLSGVDEDGYILQGLDAKSFAITGGSDDGTEFGVYEFLERYVGVRWLLPTDVGTRVPAHSDLDIPATKVAQNPVYLSRQVSPIDISQNNSLGLWGRFNRLKGRVSIEHNLYKMFSPDKYASSNPDFYPMVNNKRYIPTSNRDQTWQPNLSDDKTVDVACSQIMDYFKQNSNAQSYSLSINDSRNFDESDQSKRRRNGKTNYLGMEDVSDDYFTWANAIVQRVSKQYPGKTFGTLAYNNLAEAPDKVKLEPNIVPFITYERMRWGLPALYQQGQRITAQWAQVAANIGWYDYDYGAPYLVPRVWFHLMKDYLSWGAKNKVRYYYAELYPNWGEGPKAWVMSKLLWNPDQDVDALLNDWYVNAVGTAAAPKLRDFYATWETFWTKDVYNSAHATWYKSNGQFLPFNDPVYLMDVPEAYVTKCDQLMADAVKLANTADNKKLITELNKMWQFYKASYYAYRSKSSDGAVRTASASALQQNVNYAQQRQTMLNDFKSSSLFALSQNMMSGLPEVSGKDWGSQIVMQQATPGRNNTAMRSMMLTDTTSSGRLMSRLISARTAQVGKNASFESDMSNWNNWLSYPNQGTFTISTVVSKTGKKSMLVTGIKRGGPTQSIPYVAGSYYGTASCYIPSDYKGGTAMLTLQSIDKSGKVMNITPALPNIRIPLTPGQWSTVKAPFELTDNPQAGTLRIIVTLDGFDPDGKIYLDDVAVYKAGN
jgi:hypothetical protein